MGSYTVRYRTETVVVTVDETHPNVLYLDRGAPTVLLQIDNDHYEVRQGRWHLGDVTFCNGNVVFGWHFLPRSTRFRLNTRLYPQPEDALVGRRLNVKAVFGRDTYPVTA